MKKKVFQKIIVVLSVVSILVCCFVIPAYATVYDYKDYVVAEDVSTENTKYTVNFPVQNWFKSAINSGLDVSGSAALQFPLKFSSSTGRQVSETILFLPLGKNNYFVVDNLINGSIFSFSINCRLSLSRILTNPSQVPYFVRLAFRFFDEDYNLIGTVFNESDPVYVMEPGTSSLTIQDTREIVIEKPAGAVYFAPWIYLYQKTNVIYPDTMNPTNCTFQITDFDMYFNTSTDYLLSEALQVDNDLKQELVDGQKDIISGTPQQNAAANSMKDHMDDSISDLESAGDALDSVDKPDISDVDFNPDILGAQSYLAVVNCINSFWENPTILAMVLTLAIVMMIAVVLFGLRR